MTTFTTTNGMFNYEVQITKVVNSRKFKLRSTSKDSSLYSNDDDFKKDMFLDFGYYQAKGLKESGFTNEQINQMFNE
ncbi:MAG: hypothetical protein ACJASL_003866 [Paraglaciecola sp.]|jgi:hypothetical protein